MNSSRIAVIFCFLSLLWAGAPAGLLAHNVSVGGSEEEQHQGAAGTGSGIEAKPAGPVLDAGKDWVEEQTGAVIPLDLSFTDEGGRRMLLRDFIDRPTLLLPIYFYCPSACSRTLADLATSLGRVKATPGKDYRVIALSFNEAETADDARRAREQLPEACRQGLSGERVAVSDRRQGEHCGPDHRPWLSFQEGRRTAPISIPPALVAVGGDGKIIRYVYGEFISGDIEMAIADAAKGTPSLSVKRLLRMCFGSDPQANTAVVQCSQDGGAGGLCRGDCRSSACFPASAATPG